MDANQPLEIERNGKKMPMVIPGLPIGGAGAFVVQVAR